jgi:helix-turn-helix protein
MSENEAKVADTAGMFTLSVREGSQQDAPEWQPSRLVITTERLVLMGDDGRRSVPFGGVKRVVAASDVEETVAGEARYTRVEVGENVVCVAGDDHDSFERDLLRAFVDSEVFLVKHPAVEGGVVTDAEWTKGRLRVTDDQLLLSLAGDGRVTVERDDIGRIETAEQAVTGQQRQVVQVEHTEGETSVETHISGTRRHVEALAALVAHTFEDGDGFELTTADKEVLMALYSGVSPFEIPEFADLEVEEVEETFDRLVEAGLLERVRMRSEVALKAQGRNAASEAMMEQ